MASEERFALRHGKCRSWLRLIFKQFKAVAPTVIVLCLLSPLSGFALTTWTISSLGDNASNSATLRGAIAAAAPGDTIQFSVNGTITLSGGELAIDKNLTINGPGASSLTISGNNVGRVFHITVPTITVTISGLTISNGRVVILCCQAGRGGGIANWGTLTLTNSTVSQNSVADGGGGIGNMGTLVLINSTVSDNSSVGRGGGIVNFGVLSLKQSTVSQNSSGDIGGGIYNQNGTLKLSNTTLSGNSGFWGGAIYNTGTLTLVHGTILANRATVNGGGIYNQAQLSLKNSILAGNLDAGSTCLGGTSYGHNLADSGICSGFFTGPGDLNNTPAGVDPLGLQSNGGPTQTIALLPGSAGLNAVPGSDCTEVDGVTPILTDQRGVSRPQGAACDIGAFELEPPPSGDECTPSGLVSWWAGEDDFTDKLGTNDGTSAGGVAFATGRIGRAFRFSQSPDSYTTLPNSPTLQPNSSQLTIEGWIKPDWSVHNAVDMVLSKIDQCGGLRSYALGLDKYFTVGPYQPGVVVFSASVGGDDAISQFPVPQDDQWHHLAGTYDGSVMKAYIDGVLAGQKAHTGPMPQTIGAPLIGKQPVCGDLSAADIDEVKIYSRALTDAEIQGIYSAVQAGRCGGSPVDASAPTVACDTPDGQWHSGDESIACTVSDSGSGLANPADASFTLSTSVAAGTEDADAATGTRQVCDVAGNCAAAGPIGGNMVDKKGPTISIVSPNGNYLLGQAAASSYSCSDNGSGLAFCAGPVASGASLDTSLVGSRSFTVNATDAVGNPASVTSNYNVRFAPLGAMCYGQLGHEILQPINADGSSIFKRGSTVPAKFRVCDAIGTPVSTNVVRSFRLVQVINGTVSQVVDEAVISTTPDSSFRWDSTAQQWIFNLNSKSLNADKTYVYQITLQDDTTIDFRFGLK
jgi:hypothetical protein